MGFAGPGVVVGCAVVGAVVVIGKQRLGVGVGVDTAASGMGKRRLVVGGGVGTTGITGTASRNSASASTRRCPSGTRMHRILWLTICSRRHRQRRQRHR